MGRPAGRGWEIFLGGFVSFMLYILFCIFFFFVSTITSDHGCQLTEWNSQNGCPKNKETCSQDEYAARVCTHSSLPPSLSLREHAGFDNSAVSLRLRHGNDSCCQCKKKKSRLETGFALTSVLCPGIFGYFCGAFFFFANRGFLKKTRESHIS